LECRLHVCPARQFLPSQVRCFRPSVEVQLARAISCRVSSTHVHCVRQEAGEGGQKGADKWARWNGSVNEGRLVVELNAQCFVLGARHVVWTPALRWFCQLTYAGPFCVGVGRAPLNASVAFLMNSRLATHRALRSRLEWQWSVLASTFTAGDTEQRRASIDACVISWLCRDFACGSQYGAGVDCSRRSLLPST